MVLFLESEIQHVGCKALKLHVTVMSHWQAFCMYVFTDFSCSSDFSWYSDVICRLRFGNPRSAQIPFDVRTVRGHACFWISEIRHASEVAMQHVFISAWRVCRNGWHAYAGCFWFSPALVVYVRSLSFLFV